MVVSVTLSHHTSTWQRWPCRPFLRKFEEAGEEGSRLTLPTKTAPLHEESPTTRTRPYYGTLWLSDVAALMSCAQIAPKLISEEAGGQLVDLAR